MDMIYRYEELFSFRDKIKEEIDVVDTSFFIRPYHYKGGQKDTEQGTGMTISSGYIKRFFSILPSTHVNRMKINKG